VLTSRSTDAASAREGAVLSPQSLNRALLERQLLLRREDLGVPDVLRHLVGLQAQNPIAPYIALWSRLLDFDPEDLSGLVTARKVVRVALMRWTLHAVTVGDCMALRPVVQPVIEARMKAGFGRHLSGVDCDALVRRGRSLVEQEPRTFGDVGRLLATEWPGREPRVLANALSALTPLVHVPPRGLWGRNGRAIQTTAERWLGRPLDKASQPDEMILRYLAAFGPASATDIRTWSGLAGLEPAICRLRPHLRTFYDEHGRELLDVPDGPLPDPETAAPPRFLADNDNLVHAHADRSRILAPHHPKRLRATRTFLIDGFVAGAWRLIQGPRLTTLEITPFDEIRRPDRAALAEEGIRLLSFLAARAEQDVRLTITFLEPSSGPPAARR
jgi:hypothetical protein